MTAERTTITQVTQLGVESLSTPGTVVAATQRLQSLMITPSPKMTVQQFRPAGNKYDTLAILGKEWVEAEVTGQGVYDELIYPLCSVLCSTTPSTYLTTGKKWIFAPSSTAPDSVQTYTIENGSSVRAEQFGNGIFTELALELDREKVSLTGSMLGQRLTDPFTLSTGTTSPPLVPIVPSTINVFNDATWEASPVTQLSRVLSLKWQLSNRFGPLWVLDSSYTSFVDTIEIVPALTLTISMEADAAGMAFLSQVRAGTTTFISIQAVGPQIGSGSAVYSLLIQMPMKIVNTGGFKDDAGLYTIEWSAVGVSDPTFNAGAGGALLVTLVNSMASL